MPADLEAVWKKVDEHGRALTELEKRDAVLESRLDQVSRSMDELKAQVTTWIVEQRVRTEQTDKKIDAVKNAVEAGRGAISMAKWGVGLFVSLVTIAVAVAALVVNNG